MSRMTSEANKFGINYQPGFTKGDVPAKYHC